MPGNILKKLVPSIPFHWYHDSNIFQKENKKIFNEEWLYVCHHSSLPKIYDYKTIKVADKTVIILRDKDNHLKAFFNSCKHRGSLLLVKSEGNLKTNKIVCPYHQWTYSASTGELINTTSEKYLTFDKNSHSLNKVSITIWEGLIFINLSNKAKWKTEKVFQYYDKAFTKINFSKFLIGHTWKKTVNCNWKIYWENYSECLHCPNIHPELSKLVPLYQRRLVDIKDDPKWQILKENKNPKFQGGLKEGAETWSADGSAQGHKIDSILQELQTRGQIYISTWPTMFLGIYGDHVRIVKIFPINERQIELTAEWLFEENTLHDQNYDKNNVTDFGELVMKQDADISELNQSGTYNLGNTKGSLMPEEYIIRDFHKYLRKKLK